MRTAATLVMCGLLLLAGAFDASGQSFQGGIRGAVRDANGVIPGAEVTLTNQDTNVARTTVSNEVGEYNFPNVAPGTYTLKATLTGFKSFERSGVRIGTQQFITLDLPLEVGNIQESITVTGDAPLIETSNASTGGTLDREALESLPAPGRNAFMIGVTVPTVMPVGDPQFNRQQDQTNASRVSLGGGGLRANNYLLDGVPIYRAAGPRDSQPDHRGHRRGQGAGSHLRRGDGAHGRRRVQRHGQVGHERVSRLGLLPDAAGLGPV